MVYTKFAHRTKYGFLVFERTRVVTNWSLPEIIKETESVVDTKSIIARLYSNKEPLSDIANEGTTSNYSGFKALLILFFCVRILYLMTSSCYIICQSHCAGKEDTDLALSR